MTLRGRPRRARGPDGPAKTVWVLGAGFSKQGGYPVVSDFLNPSFFIHWLLHEELRGEGQPQARFMMPEVERWTRLGGDLNKLMSQFLDGGDFERARELNRFILQTLNMVCRHHQDVFYIPYLSAFANLLGATDSSVISFNYDTLVEEKLCHIHVEHHADENKFPIPPAPYTLGMDPRTCVSFTDSRDFRDYGSGFIPYALPWEGDLKVLKVHGSTCLWYCRECLTAIYRTPVDPPGPMTTFHCSRCGRETEQDLLFVPPASDRNFPAWQALEPLWRQAEQELLTARNLVIVGYSLPAEDERARGLLSEAVRRNPGLRALIVDPFLGEAQQKRFAGVFPAPLFLKESCKGLMGILATLRTRRKSSVLKALPRDVGSLLSDLVSVESSRPGGPLPGSTPLGFDLMDALEGEGHAAHSTAAINMLGLSASLPVRKALHRRAASPELDPHTRGLIARALGSIADQTSLAWLGDLLLEIKPYERKPSRLPGLTPPQTISLFARTGILQIAFSDPTLDFADAINKLTLLVVHGLLMEYEQLQALTALSVLRNAHVLANRYAPEDCFGIDAARAGRPAYRLRSEPGAFTQPELEAVVKGRGFYDLYRNPEGGGPAHDYAAPFIAGEWVVVDYASGLMWALGTHRGWVLLCQQGMTERLLEELNSAGYAGHKDWRLPTVEEAMSLLRPPADDGWCEDPIFLRRADRIWTCDDDEHGVPLVVALFGGYYIPAWGIQNMDAYLRAVRRL